MPICSVNPLTGETLRTFATETPEQTAQKVGHAAAAFPGWSRLPVGQRGQVLREAATLLEAEIDSLATLATAEMGKTFRAARDEVAKCAATCRYYADHAEEFLRPDPVVGRDEGVWFQPLGVVLAVMPWNFAYWQAVRFLAPALAAGNVALLKHASNVPQCALALTDVFARAGAPAGTFQALL